MYLTAQEARELAESLSKASVDEQNTVAIFPSMIVLSEVVDILAQSDIAVGAQHVAWTPQGAYTGAVSAHIVKEAGGAFALVGHSERRHIFKDSNEFIRKRLEACLAAGLRPVLCVGDTQEDVELHQQEFRLKKQLQDALEYLEGAERVIVAYEPVWAISQGGKGTPCSPELASQMHVIIRKEIALYTEASLPVLYGGSVNETNMVSFTSQAGIDGVLVGSASTKFGSFAAMIR